MFLPLFHYTAQDMDTPTCRAVDSVAQYMTVFLGNLTNSQEHTPSCRAVRPFCNSFLCTLPNRAGFFNNSFLPCDNPIGFSSLVIDHLSNISQNITQYQSGPFMSTLYSSVDLTLDQLGPDMVGFAVSLKCNMPGGKLIAIIAILFFHISAFSQLELNWTTAGRTAGGAIYQNPT